MAQVARPERIDKLQQAFKGVEDDYLRIMNLGTNGYRRDGAEEWETEDGEEEEEEEDGRPSKRIKL